MKNEKILVYLLSFFVLLLSCTDLEEEIVDKLIDQDDADVASLLDGAYVSMSSAFVPVAGIFALQEHTTDAAIPPTRGSDWDDNGAWRVLHTHQWTDETVSIRDTYNNLLTVVFNTSNILTFGPTVQQSAEARFLRVISIFYLADGWDQVPIRDGETLENLLLPPEVLSGVQAMDFIVSELNEIMSDLPEGIAGRASKNAASTLMMKVLLNRGVYANRNSPSFDNGDMQQVISLADGIINSGSFSLSENFYDSFLPNNDETSSENIFTVPNDVSTGGAEMHNRWMGTSHYNQTLGGWNGFATLSDYYDAFEDGDVRKEFDYPGFTEETGIKMGFMIGQQYDGDGVALEDRKGNPLIFTREVALTESGNNLEVTGIRVMKYLPDRDNVTGPAGNDFVVYRYADVLLMKAEASMRTGDDATALSIVNEIRTKRNASTLSTLSLDDMLAERGRELVWEQHRRTDLIRFGKFTDAWQEKPASKPESVLFPIPSTVLATNPNLVQNPGY